MVRMMALGGAVAALALGCSTQYPADAGGDDAPDGGMGSDSDGGNGGGSDSGTGSGSGANPITIELLSTTIKDERLDQIAFGAEGPHHRHGGPDIVLGGSGCPSVFKYSYLLDEQAPEFGSEETPNPLFWKFRTTGGTGAITAEYRIVDETGTSLLDWTAATKESDDSYLVVLHRSGTHGVPALNAQAGQYKIELRAGDPSGNSGTADACWDHHPLAAPIRFTGLVASSASDALKSFTLVANSPVSPLMNTGAGVKVFAGSITHTTAEPVTIKLEIPKPSASYTKTVVHDLLDYTWPEDTLCRRTCTAGHPNCAPYQSSLAVCSEAPAPSDPQDVTSSGTLSSGQWSAVVFEGTRVASECSVTGPTVTCGLPGRISGAPPTMFTVVLRASQLDELKPGTGLVGEHVAWERNYTGFGLNAAENQVRCDQMVDSMPRTGVVEYRCKLTKNWSTLHAIDHVRLDISGPAMNVTTAIPAKDGLPASPLVAPPYVPNGTVNGTPFVWDSGNDDLPGPQH